MTQASDRLSYGQLISYALPMLSLHFIWYTVGLYLPIYYTDQLGVAAGMISWVFLFGRIWDAITDPAMGHISDRTRTRWGRRRPYFLFSALPIWFFFYLIWSPGTSLSPTGLFVYLLVTYILLYTLWTMFYIPYYSLGMELTPDYHERSRLFGVQQAIGIIGVIVGTYAPVWFTIMTSGKTAEGYPLMGIVMGGISASLILIAFFLVKERHAETELEAYPFFKGLSITFRNRAFIILILTYMTTLVGSSFIGPLGFYMTKYVIKEEWALRPASLVYMLCALASVPVWVAISKKIGKNKTWSAAMFLGACGYAIIYMITEGMWLGFILCTIPVGGASGCTMTLGPSILADVIDSDELETGTRREGAFFGLRSFVDKAAVGIAIFIGLQGLQWIGYVPNVDQSQSVITGITILYSLLPCTLTFVALLIFQTFPITQEVHAKIREQLEARKQDQMTTESES